MEPIFEVGDYVWVSLKNTEKIPIFCARITEILFDPIAYIFDYTAVDIAEGEKYWISEQEIINFDAMDPSSYIRIP